MWLINLQVCGCMLLQIWILTNLDEIKENINVQLISPPSECHKALRKP